MGDVMLWVLGIHAPLFSGVGMALLSLLQAGRDAGHPAPAAVYLVLSGRGRLQVLVGGRPVKTIRVGGLSRLYTLLRYPSLSEGALELRFTPGISAYAFTFG